MCDMTCTGDAVANVSGGLRQGVAALGYLTAGVGCDTQKAKWWQGGTFYLGAGFTFGRTPSAELIGDAHIVDNIEAGNHVFLRELWYEQCFGDKLNVKIGMQDLNEAFVACDETGHFLHSSLGINAVVSANVGVPIFPLMGCGVTAASRIQDRLRSENRLSQRAPLANRQQRYVKSNVCDRHRTHHRDTHTHEVRQQTECF